ncbi:hypothetical protein V8E54_010291 [Elaphomyces granulatus]
MRERSFSRLLKTKLLSRSSSSTMHESTTKAANAEAGPRVDANSKSNSITSCLPSSPLPSRDARSQRPRPCSTASSVPVDCPVSSGDIAGAGAVAGAASTAAGSRAGARAAPVNESQDPEGKPDSPLHQDGDTSSRPLDDIRDNQDDRDEASPSTAASPRSHTPLGEPLFRPSTATIHSSTGSQNSDVVSGLEVSMGARERPANIVVTSHLPSPLDTVDEQPFDFPGRVPNLSHAPSSVPRRLSLAIRRQSLLPVSQQHLVKGLLEPGLLSQEGDPSISPLTSSQLEMVLRKIWVRRPNASATLVSIAEDTLVDELRDQVIRKYHNSLGKFFDSPDLQVKILPREGSNRHSSPERILNPEEPVTPVIDAYYPGGQAVEEALVIEPPLRRTPKPSPRQSAYYHAEPGEYGEYFPLMPVNVNTGTPPTHSQNSLSSASGVSTHQTPSISVLATGKVPPLPSPGARTSRHPRRPVFPRHSTNSPTHVGPSSAAKEPNAAVISQNTPTAPSLPTPPAPAPAPESPRGNVLAPPARVASPRPTRKSKKGNGLANGAAFGGLIDGTVPPINVLIVEDNVINQKLLEAFMRRLSVRWQCAPNGEVAVRKWRQGGFHLVLMDIQLPVMNGLEAAKEIRRLERLNGVGVFSRTASGRSSAASTPVGSVAGSRDDDDVGMPLKEEDVLENISLFKSPVIIVALTASSLQSDRHEALAAGCNDFLTKPVGFPWLEQKVTEWGCMQALIDFEGWRKWRGFSDSTGTASPADSTATARPLSQVGNGTPTPGKVLPASARGAEVQALDTTAGSGVGDGLDSGAVLDETAKGGAYDLL